MHHNVMAGKTNNTSMTASAEMAGVVKVEVIKAYDGVPEGSTKLVNKGFPYLGYMVKEVYWKKID